MSTSVLTPTKGESSFNFLMFHSAPSKSVDCELRKHATLHQVTHSTIDYGMSKDRGPLCHCDGMDRLL